MNEQKTPRDNVQITETDTDIIIRVRKKEDYGLSSSGKTRVIASSSGFMTLNDGIMVNLNVVRRESKK